MDDAQACARCLGCLLRANGAYPNGETPFATSGLAHQGVSKCQVPQLQMLGSILPYDDPPGL